LLGGSAAGVSAACFASRHGRHRQRGRRCALHRQRGRTQRVTAREWSRRFAFRRCAHDVGEWLAVYLEQVAKLKVRPRTFDRYRSPSRMSRGLCVRLALSISSWVRERLERAARPDYHTQLAGTSVAGDASGRSGCAGLSATLTPPPARSPRSSESPHPREWAKSRLSVID
jgi:hypothetical protein